MSDLPYVDLDRDLLEDLPCENWAQFSGEWDPAEKDDAGWETFTVMFRGEEAGDSRPATWGDLRRVLAQWESQ